MTLFEVPSEPRDTDDWATPPDVFMRYDRVHHFTIDVAAAAHNTKCERFYDAAADGLAQDWTDEAVWCNPPYSDIRPWVQKAADGSARVACLLIPANRTEQTWWQDLVEPFRDRGGALTSEFLRGRIRFLLPGARRAGAGESPLFGSVVLTWRH